MAVRTVQHKRWLRLYRVVGRYEWQKLSRDHWELRQGLDATMIELVPLTLCIPVLGKTVA